MAHRSISATKERGAKFHIQNDLLRADDPNECLASERLAKRRLGSRALGQIRSSQHSGVDLSVDKQVILESRRYTIKKVEDTTPWGSIPRECSAKTRMLFPKAGIQATCVYCY